MTHLYKSDGDDRVELSKRVGDYSEMVEIAIRKFCVGPARMEDVILFYAPGNNGEKFRLAIIAKEVSGQLRLIELFGSVKYAHLKLKDLKSGSIEDMKYDKVREFSDIEHAYDKLDATIAFFKKEKRRDIPRWMFHVSSQIKDQYMTGEGELIVGEYEPKEIPVVAAPTGADEAEQKPDIPVVDSTGKELSWHEDW